MPNPAPGTTLGGHARISDTCLVLCGGGNGCIIKGNEIPRHNRQEKDQELLPGRRILKEII
jgi:hypothetical protein